MFSSKVTEERFFLAKAQIFSHLPDGDLPNDRIIAKTMSREKRGKGFVAAQLNRKIAEEILMRYP